MRRLVALAGLAALVTLGGITHNVGTYNGLNKGVYVFHCGVELVGQPGVFCNQG